MRRILALLLALTMFAGATPQTDIEEDILEAETSLEARFWQQTTILQSRTPQAWLQLLDQGLLLETLEQESMENVQGGSETQSLEGADGGSGDLLLFRASNDFQHYSIHEKAADEAALTFKGQNAQEHLGPAGDINNDGHVDIGAIVTSAKFGFDFNTQGYFFDISFEGRFFDARTEENLGELSFEIFIEEEPSSGSLVGVQPDVSFLRAEITTEVRTGQDSISSHIFEEWSYESADIYVANYQLGESSIERTGNGYIERTSGETHRVEFDDPTAIYEFPDFTGDDVPDLAFGSVGTYEETQNHMLLISDPAVTKLSGNQVSIVDGATFELIFEGPWDESSALTVGPIPGSFIIHRLTANGMAHEWLGAGTPQPMKTGWHTYSGFLDVNGDGEVDWLRKKVDRSLLEWQLGPQSLVNLAYDPWVETMDGAKIWSVTGEYLALETSAPTRSLVDVDGKLAMVASTDDTVELRRVDNTVLSSVPDDNLASLDLIDAVDGGLEWFAVYQDSVGGINHFNATLIDAANNKSLWTRELLAAKGDVGFWAETMDNARGSEAREIIVNAQPWVSFNVACNQNGCTSSQNQEASFHRVILIDGATGKAVQQFRSGTEEFGIFETEDTLKQTSYGRAVEKELPAAPLLTSLVLLGLLAHRRRFQ